MQRRTTQSILRSRMGEMSYKERLIRLDMLPLVYNRELHDITFFYKCLYGHKDLNVHNFFYFVTHSCTRQSNSFNLKVPICKLPHFRPLTSIGLSNYRTPFVKLLLKAASLVSTSLKTFEANSDKPSANYIWRGTTVYLDICKILPMPSLIIAHTIFLFDIYIC